MLRILRAIAFTSFICLAAVSCDGGGGYKVSGKVTFAGNPVPKGQITFSPDTAQGNTGPSAVAQIVNGEYRTETGIAGGAYHIRIIGTDGKPTTTSGEELPEGKPLFEPFETSIDLPKENTTKDFEIPAKR